MPPKKNWTEPNGLRTILYGNPETVFELKMQVRPRGKTYTGQIIKTASRGEYLPYYKICKLIFKHIQFMCLALLCKVILPVLGNCLISVAGN